MNSRSQTYQQVSRALTGLSDKRLMDLIEKAQPNHSGVGGKSLLLKIDDTPIFIKKIPLTDLERRPENYFSTANMFDLPVCCQYGIGVASPGFGVWRELLAHIMTTDWVVSGECLNFPILYHWRVLPTTEAEPMNVEEWGSLENYFKLWDDAAVRKRVEAKNGATFQILLFLEYFPQTLYPWLCTQLRADDRTSESAIHLVEESLKTANDFMISRGFLHFDAHFGNILTDETLICLSDFGLATSLRFDLCQAEIDFFNSHKSYDKSSAAISLVHTVITSAFGKDSWQIALPDYLNGKRGELAPPLASIIKKYATVAQAVDQFNQLLKDGKKTLAPYPGVEFERLLQQCIPQPRL